MCTNAQGQRTFSFGRHTGKFPVISALVNILITPLCHIRGKNRIKPHQSGLKLKNVCVHQEL